MSAAFLVVFLNLSIFFILIAFSDYFVVLPISFLYAVAEEGREYDGGSDDEHARAEQHQDRLHYAVLSRIPLDIDLERGYDGQHGGNRIADVQDIQQVLYFTCNSIDNQIYIDFENYKCSQNETRIVLPISMRNGCVQLLQNWMKSAIKAHCVVKHILTV